jgi:hypothetical protein
MATFTVRGRITADGRLEVQLPPDAPVGDAEVTVSVAEPMAPLGSPERILAALKEIHSRPGRVYRSKEEIDRALEEERDSWGDARRCSPTSTRASSSTWWKR